MTLPKYKATIKNWTKLPDNQIIGDFEGHPDFSDKFTNTSPVIRCVPLDNGDYEILTRSKNWYLLRAIQ